MSTSPHVAKARAYCAGVLSGEIPACKWVRKACERQVNDLARAAGGGWVYRFDEDAAEAVCSFIELWPHIKGDKAGAPLIMEPWQCFVLTTAFGWVRREDGKRRFRRSYIEVPRGNGKSTLSSGVALFGLSMDGEEGAEVYSAATTRDQARIVFRDAQNMVRRNPVAASALGIQVNAHNICILDSASKFEALSAEGSTLDGLNIHIAVVDELHAHKTRDVYDVLETGTGKRSQSMLWTITTAGSDRAGICYEIRSLLVKILDGVATDEAFFGCVWTADEGDDWTSPDTWRKANPNWGVSVRPEVVEQLCEKAKLLPAAQNNFKTKHLDLWVSVDAALYDVEMWRKCADPSLTRESLRDWFCIPGLDLANKNDLASRADLFWRLRDDGQPEFAALFSNYSNRQAVDSAKNSQYSGWEISGYLEVHDGDSTGQAQIEADLLQFARAHGVDRLAIDKYEGDYLAERLQASGLTVIVVPMNVAHLSKPTKELETLMRERRIRHNGDPVAEWAISNVIGHLDKNDNVFPHKERPENKIDPVIALLVALSVALREIEPQMSAYRTAEHFAEEGVMFL